MDHNEYLDIWSRATELVSEQLPEYAVEFEWPGNIDVYIDAETLLTYGSVNETINANISRLVDGVFQPDESLLPDSLITDVPSDATDPDIIATAVVASIRLWREGSNLG